MKSKTKRLFGVLVAAAMVWSLSGCGLSSGSDSDADRINIVQALSSDESNDCYETADGVIPFEFPRDHGAHDRFKTEWWYYTGNLKTVTGRHFGYQLTFFRQGLACEVAPPGENTSEWQTRQLYFAHFAVTDTREKRFHSGMRINRDSLGISGALSDPFQVWIDDWQVTEKEGLLMMSARHERVSVQLQLTREKPMILQGDNGFSRKGRDDFNASYYYSLPRLATRGDIRIEDITYPVTGLSWFDHEWSTSALSADVVGWDWFSVHLDDGRDLMVCRVRNAQGAANGYGFGSVSRADGSFVILSEDEFQIRVTDHWKSPESGTTYPSAWQILVPDHDISLNVVPVIPNQEHVSLFAYWEGAARFEGDTVSGIGYVEMTGY